MTTHVSLQRVSPGIAVSTVVTDIRQKFVRSGVVSQHVSVKCAPIIEAGTALAAQVSSLSAMKAPRVHRQILPRSEQFSAHGAFGLALPAVGRHVVTEAVFRQKILSALVAGKCRSTMLLELVLFETRVGLRAELTDVALVWLVTAMHSHMILHSTQRYELLVANFAAVRAPDVVHLHVLPQSVRI